MRARILSTLALWATSAVYTSAFQPGTMGSFRPPLGARAERRADRLPVMSAAAETQAGVAPAGTTTRKPRVSKPRAASTTTTRGSSTAASASPAATKTRGAAAAVKEAPEVVDPYAEVVWRKVQVTSVKLVSADGLIRKVRLESLPERRVGRASTASLGHWSSNTRQPGQWLALETIPHIHDLSGSWASAAGGPLRVTLPIASPPEPREGLVGNNWIDVLLDERHVPEGARLSQALTLGAIVNASQELGSGFEALLGFPFRVAAMMMQQLDLLIVAKGSDGMGAASSVMNWPRLGLHALKHRVTVVVEVETPLHDPLLDEQDRWRTLHSPHVRVIPVMTASRTSTAELDRTLTLPLSADASPPVSSDDEDSDFKPRVRSLCPHLAMEADNTAVLIAGFPHKRREAIIASLVDAGVSPFRILSNDIHKPMPSVGSGKRKARPSASSVAAAAAVEEKF